MTTNDEIIRLATGKKHITLDSVLYLTMNRAIEEGRIDAVQETFSLLDHIAQIEHGTDLESCLLNGRSKGSQRILQEFKKKWGLNDYK